MITIYRHDNKFTYDVATDCKESQSSTLDSAVSFLSLKLKTTLVLLQCPVELYRLLSKLYVDLLVVKQIECGLLKSY